MADLSYLLTQAQTLCEQRGARMTSHRMLVYRLLIEHNQAISAYDLLDKLKKIAPKAKPPTIYRALDFLVAQGLVHKIESTSSFIACGHIEQEKHCSQLLICSKCALVTELHNPHAIELLTQKSAEAGFAMTHHIIETHGLCASCKRKG